MRPWWRLAAALAVVGVLCLPRAAAAVVTGGCTAEGHSTSSSVDITTATEWHLKSTDTAGGSGTSPVKMRAAQVYAYALGIEIPIASGTGDGGTSGAVDGVSVAPFAILGHRFTVAGSASGDGACSGSITIILDDVTDAQFRFVDTPHAADVPTFRLQNVENVDVFQCRPTPDTHIDHATQQSF